MGRNAFIPRGWGKTGEYAIDELEVRIIHDNLAYISCERYIINSPRETWSVSVGWLEKRRGMTLEEKVQAKRDEIISYLENENKKIRQQREMQERLNKR